MKITNNKKAYHDYFYHKYSTLLAMYGFVVESFIPKFNITQIFFFFLAMYLYIHIFPKKKLFKCINNYVFIYY